MTIKEQSGFSLIEVLIALSVLIMVLGGVTSLAMGVIRTSRISKQELEAYAQAQEQMELVRQIRNTNLIDGDKNTKWNDLDCSNTCHVELNNNTQEWRLSNGPGDWSSLATNQTYDKYLMISTTNDSAISDQNILKVASVVEWEDRTGQKEIRLVTYLTDWLWGYEE